ncbi:MAG: thiamine phosphate synthase [Acidimicrobiales bacterium]|nr:thiamine phosphate synthase [Acidimicrobiales bacterium]
MLEFGPPPITPPVRMDCELPRLHVVTPDRADPAALETIAEVVEAGARCVQVRLKSAPDRIKLWFVSEVVGLTRAAGALCLVDDRADLAAAAGAGGVHLGLDDLPPVFARALLGPTAVIGATARDPETARRLQDEGVSYLGVGPVYPSTTKRHGLPEPLGPAGVEKIAAAVDIPVIAISGITVASVPELLAAGAYGVAAIAAIFGAADPAQAVREFLGVLGS